MKMPFPGMDPYLEHPVLWESLHAWLVTTIAEQLQPLLEPRYVASIEERVFIEGAQRRIPDVWVQRVPEEQRPIAVALEAVDTAVVLEVAELEVRQRRVEILDLYNSMKLVTLIEVVSPTNKAKGPGRRSYLKKQREVLRRDCHLVEIDLLRTGRHVQAIPHWRLQQELRAFDYLTCVNRWSARSRFELYERRLRERLPRIRVPLAEPDPDVPLDIQAAFARAYWNGRYFRRVRYHEPCEPPLSPEDQAWAGECWQAFKAAHPGLFPAAGT